MPPGINWRCGHTVTTPYLTMVEIGDLPFCTSQLRLPQPYASAVINYQSADHIKAPYYELRKLLGERGRCGLRPHRRLCRLRGRWQTPLEDAAAGPCGLATETRTCPRYRAELRTADPYSTSCSHSSSAAWNCWLPSTFRCHGNWEHPCGLLYQLTACLDISTIRRRCEQRGQTGQPDTV